MAILSNINGKFAVEDNGAIKFNNLTGTNNQVLIANTNSSPTWVNVDTIIGGPYLPLTGGTLAGAGNLVVGGTLTVNGIGTFNTPAGGVAFNLDAAADNYGAFRLRTNGNVNKWDIGIKNDNDFYIYNQATSAQAFEIDTANNNATFAGVVTIPTMAGNPDFTGDIYQYGIIFRNASFIDVVGNRNSKIELETAYFTHTVSNQAVNIQFPNVAMQGYYKITLSGSYSHQDISGKLTKVIPFGYNPNGSIWRTGNSQSEITIATGGVSTNFTIGNLAWDSTNSKFIVPIYKLTSTGNSVRILIEYFGAAANNLKNVNLSSNYTQTAPSPFNVRQYQNIRDRLGIGTASPDAKLEVNVASGDGILIKSADVSTFKMKGGGGVYDWGLATTNLAAHDFGIYKSNVGGGDPITAGTAQLYFKSTGSTTSNVGIGTTSPSTRLEIEPSTVNSSIKTGGLEMQSYSINNGWYAENLYYDGVWRLRSAGFATQMYMETGTISFKRVASGSAGASVSPETTMRLHSSGNIGINMTGTPNRKLQIEGGATYPLSVNSTQRYLQEFKRSGVSEWWIAVDNGSFIIHENGVGDKITVASGGTLTAAGDLVAYSDERLKTNIKTLNGSKVLKMRGVSFEKEGKKGSGVIAQELEKVAPELVNNDNEYKGVAYGNLTGYLIEAIKELEARIKELENK